MKILDGSEIAAYIKAGQAREVRSLKQSKSVVPAMAIVQDNPSKLNSLYTGLKRRYAEDIDVICEVKSVEPGRRAVDVINELNKQSDVHGIIVQLPVSEPKNTDEIIEAIDPVKDVDGLRANSPYDPATPLAIMWLLAGYNIDLQGKKVTVVGQGRLVGNPLSDMLEKSGVSVERLDEHSQNLDEKLQLSDIIITATGQPGLIKSTMVKNGAVLIDAGTAAEGEAILGDADPELRERDDIAITPAKGGAGPLTVCALFGNLLRAAREAGSS